jgi:uncharacterized protein YfkK (UPF0435 family)
MTPELNEKLTLVECALISESDYLEVSAQSGYIYILISKREYKFYTLSERIYSVFELLKLTVPEILYEHPFLIETFSEPELTDLFRMYRK